LRKRREKGATFRQFSRRSEGKNFTKRSKDRLKDDVYQISKGRKVGPDENISRHYFADDQDTITQTQVNITIQEHSVNRDGYSSGGPNFSSY